MCRKRKKLFTWSRFTIFVLVCRCVMPPTLDFSFSADETEFMQNQSDLLYSFILLCFLLPIFLSSLEKERKKGKKKRRVFARQKNQNSLYNESEILVPVARAPPNILFCLHFSVLFLLLSSLVLLRILNLKIQLLFYFILGWIIIIFSFCIRWNCLSII